jgi:hypothetical protein
MHHKEDGNARLRGFEGLETRILLAADLGVAVLDTADTGEKQDAPAYFELQDGSLAKNEASVAITNEYESIANKFTSAAEDAIDSIFDHFTTENLGFIMDSDPLGINELVDVADGLGGLNPPESNGGGGIDIPDFVDPEGLGGSDSDGAPVANGPESLLTPSADLEDHAGGIANTGPGAKHPNGDATRVTVTDVGGLFYQGRQIVAGTQTDFVKPDGTTVRDVFITLENGTIISSHATTQTNGQVHEERQTTVPPTPAESVDPDAEPTAVLLPHQAAPNFDPSSGLENPDLFNPEQPDESGPKTTTIDPGEGIVVNPAGEAGQARQVSRELAEHWKDQLKEGGTIID